MDVNKQHNLFIVTSNTFIEGGEYWYQPEGEGGRPILAFSTELQAQKACIKMNRDEIHITDLNAYANDIFDITNNIEGLKLFLQSRALSEDLTDWDVIAHLDISEDDKEELTSHIALEFYSWYEVPLEQTKIKKESVLNNLDERFKNLDI